MEKFKFLAKNKINFLPRNPGVYIFKNGGKILYIGKAVNIRERVKNHFPSRSEGGRRTNVPRTSQPAYRDNLFINRVEKIGYLKTYSEIEALILEANLIKKYQPKYNVVWRDDKNYFYVGITKENFPRILLTHQKKIENCKLKISFIGPFVDGKSLKAALKILRKIFPYRSCKNLPKKPCLWHQLDRCPAPCLLKSETGRQIPEFQNKMGKECRQNVKNLIKVLQGKKKQVLKSLKKEMEELSGLQNFERAAKIRDQIRALEKILAHAKIFEQELPQKSDWPEIQKILRKILKTENKIYRIEAYDVSNIQGQLATGSMITFINGLPDKNFYRKFKIKIAGKPNDTAMIKEVLTRRLKHLEWPYPELILIDGGRGQLNAAKECLTSGFEPCVMALAKRKNELFIERRKNPILLKNLPREIFNLMLQLRDEAHRFTLAYHHKLRKINLLK